MDIYVHIYTHTHTHAQPHTHTHLVGVIDIKDRFAIESIESWIRCIHIHQVVHILFECARVAPLLHVYVSVYT